MLKINEILKQSNTDTQRNVVVKTLANYHNVPLDRIKLKTFKVESITADYDLLTDNSADTYIYTFQTVDNSDNITELGNSLVSVMNDVIPQEEDDFINEDLGDITSFTSSAETTVSDFKDVDVPVSNIWTTYPDNKYYKTYYP